MKILRHVASLLVFGALFASAQATVVYSNSPLGDNFTNPGTTLTGQAVGTSGWYYNNVRNNGVVGINGTYPRNGNGSVYFKSSQGGSTSSKADIEFFGSAVQNNSGNWSPTSSLGKLKDLSHLSYDWYRDSQSTVQSHFHPVIRLLVAGMNNNAFVSGYLVFERAYNPSVSPVPTDQWVSESIVGTTNLWSTGSLPFAFNKYDYTLSDWQTNYGDLDVVGVSLGVGSGWGPNAGDIFVGAVDNVRFGFTNGPSYDFNFEVAAVTEPVPEPFTMGLVAAGLAAGLRRRRRAQS